MSGLDKIINEILNQASVQADEISNDAKNKASAILEKGAADRAEWKSQFDEDLKQQCGEIIKQAESVDRQNRRRALLEARNQVVSEVISEAKEKIMNLSDKEYFNLLFRLYEKNAQPQDGTICFAPKDYARIPEDFLSRCKQIFPEYTLDLHNNTENIGSGFVLQYGNIIHNCTIDEIFESEGQSLRDKAHEILSADA